MCSCMSVRPRSETAIGPVTVWIVFVALMVSSGNQRQGQAPIPLYAPGGSVEGDRGKLEPVPLLHDETFLADGRLFGGFHFVHARGGRAVVAPGFHLAHRA